MTRVATLAIISFGFLVAGCGSDDSASIDPTGAPTVVTQAPTPATSAPITTDAPPAPEASPTSGPATSDAPAAETTLPANPIVIDDMGYVSLEEMAAAASLVIHGTVTDETSLGRPDVEADPSADEYLGLTVSVDALLKGSAVDEVRLGWDAYVVDANGERAATNVMNGIDVPRVGDEVLLFLQPIDADAARFMGGFPTHAPVSLDGIAFVEDHTVTATDDISADVIGLPGKTIEQIAALISAA
jgi:hypothetical protein